MAYLIGREALSPKRKQCVLCGEFTDFEFDPQGHPEVGPLPLHVGCAAYLVAMYPDWKSAQPNLPRLKIAG